MGTPTLPDDPAAQTALGQTAEPAAPVAPAAKSARAAKKAPARDPSVPRRRQARVTAPRGTARQTTAETPHDTSLRGLADAGVSAGRRAAHTAESASRTAAAGAGHVGTNVSRGTARAAGNILGIGAPPPADSEHPVADVSIRLPFASAELRLPGPGAVASIGPVKVTLPTGALYYGGLAALVLGGALELPVAAGAAIAGAVIGRRWLRRPVPEISVEESHPDGAAGGREGPEPTRE